MSFRSIWRCVSYGANECPQHTKVRVYITALFLLYTYMYVIFLHIYLVLSSLFNTRFTLAFALLLVPRPPMFCFFTEMFHPPPPPSSSFRCFPRSVLVPRPPLPHASVPGERTRRTATVPRTSCTRRPSAWTLRTTTPTPSSTPTAPPPS